MVSENTLEPRNDRAEIRMPDSRDPTGPRPLHWLVVGAAAATIITVAALWPIEVDDSGPTADWPHYGNDLGGMRYSPVAQITPDNVKYLEEAWVYHTGDVWSGGAGATTAFELTPIVVDDTMFVCTPYNRVLALDPETGAEIWSFDPQLDREVDYANQYLCRSVAYWSSPAGSAPCSKRILTATNDARLIALDSVSGKPCADFGRNGEVDLAVGVGEFRWPGEYQVTSAPVVVGDIVVVGSAVGDNTRTDAPSGVVRGYDVRSGALRWAWDPVPPADTPDQDGTDSSVETAYHLASPNAWAPLSGDEERGLVFIPTGNPVPDYWSATRQGLDYYGSSVVALDATTGEVTWSYQTVHHDLWDFDVPAQPTLFPLRRNGREIPALVQATKMGFLFVLDRETGQPLFEVEERPVPQTEIPGEITSPTQPFPTELPWLVPTELAAEDAFGFTPWDRGACRERLEQLRFDGMYTPPSLEGSLMFPGNAGGSNWGGVAVDPKRGLVVANTMSLAWSVTLFERGRLEELREQFPDAEFSPQEGTPYALMRETLFSPLGVPCNPPPWGTLAAVDLATGELRWQVELGTIADLIPVPLRLRYGVPNLGGPLITSSGLVFIAATVDDYLRAFDIEDGRELWKARLPAGGQATPMTYRLREDSRQYVVIAAGGHGRAGTRLGDAIVAYALPD